MARDTVSVLVAVDFSPASIKALREAGRLAGRMGASLTLLHVPHFRRHDPQGPRRLHRPGHRRPGVSPQE